MNPYHQVIYRSNQELLIYRTPYLSLKYRVFQIYGQKYVKLLDTNIHPEPYTEVYADNIPRKIDIEKLFKFFAQCGPIYQIRLLMDFSGCNRGKCFVQYQYVLASREAICCLHEEAIEGDHRVFVKLSLNNNQLILKSIPEYFTEADMIEIIRRRIGEGLVSVVLKKSYVPETNYCFCTYRDHQFAIMAHKKAWPFMNIGGNLVDVHWAVPELLRSSCHLYFTNFYHNMTKMQFFRALIKKINMRNLVQFRLFSTHGYITFSNFNAMKNAEVSLRNLTIAGYRIKFSRKPFTVGATDQICVWHVNERQNKASSYEEGERMFRNAFNVLPSSFHSFHEGHERMFRTEYRTEVRTVVAQSSFSYSNYNCYSSGSNMSSACRFNAPIIMPWCPPAHVSLVSRCCDRSCMNFKYAPPRALRRR